MRSLRHPARRGGFTLVELLIVIAIIAVLISILIPAIGKVRRLAVRTSCAATLRQWSAALSAYASDNQGNLPRCAWQSYNPATCWAQNVVVPDYWQQPYWPAEISFAKMVRYLPGADVPGYGQNLQRASEQVYVRGAWLCPAMASQSMSEGLRPFTWNPWDYNYTVITWYWMPYSYYFDALASNVNGLYCPFPNDIANDANRSADRILMSDTCIRMTGTTYYFNHSLTGTAYPIFDDEHTLPLSAGWPADIPTGLAASPETFISQFDGMNELMGDGHVIWKTRDDIQPATLDANWNADANSVHRAYYNFY